MFGSLDLWLDHGHALHLVGPNGIGKTSLMRILAGLVPPSPTHFYHPDLPDIGLVRWNGSVALLDERPALDTNLPLGMALAFWRSLDGTKELPLQRLGLENLLDVPVQYLSTGQKKRAALARLIGQGADHWLLDEPLNGLDKSGVLLVEELIAEKRAAGGVVVLASHQAIEMPGCETIDLRDHPQ